jgi:ADP-ribose pyrophosphatase
MIVKDIKTIFQGYYKIDELTLKTNKGNTITRELFNNKDGIGAIVYNTKLNKYILIKQWRIATKQPIVEIVGGSIEQNQSPINTVHTEVLEEIGYKCDAVIPITCFYPSPGAIAEKVFLYYVEVSEQITPGGGNQNEDEDIELVYLSHSDLINTIFDDAKTIIAVNYIKQHFPLID